MPPPDRKRRASCSVGLLINRLLSGVTSVFQGGACPPAISHSSAAALRSASLLTSVGSHPAFTSGEVTLHVWAERQAWEYLLPPVPQVGCV